MTVETCVDFCSGKGFSVAGTEYGNECYCANSIPADAAPVPGHMGNCMMPCAGDPAEYCGGPGTISLYQKCSGTCQNVQYGVVGNSTSPSVSSAAPVFNVGSSSSAASKPAMSPTDAQISVTATATSGMAMDTNGDDAY